MHGATELLRRVVAVSTISFLKHNAWMRVRGPQEFRKFRIAQSGITVSVDSADDGQQLALGGVVAARSQEGAQIQGGDTSVVILVDGSESGVGRVVVATLEVTLEDVQSALEFDFLLKDVEQSKLDVTGQAIVFANIPGWAVKCDVSQQVVLARQEQLKEPRKFCY